jgi:hypothetical protein
MTIQSMPIMTIQLIWNMTIRRMAVMNMTMFMTPTSMLVMFTNMTSMESTF